ncbi:MAG: GumC family protein [Deltaproteobacteria bacterium]|nr:GumC family protein [Deltaproteobacteria bacterium]
MASGPGKSSGFEVREYIKVLVKRRWTIATFFVIVVTLITLATFMRVPIFRATATLQILPEAPTYVDFKGVVALGSSNYWALKEYYETQFRIIKSRPVAAAVLDELELRGVDPYKDAKDPEAVLIDQIQVEPVKSSQLVQIHAEHSNAELAARLANTVAAVYQKQNLERTKTISNEASKWLEGEQGTMVDRLGESEKTLQKFMEDNKVFSFEERFNTALINLAKFTEALAEARRDRIEAQSLITKYKEMKAKGQAMMIPAVMENALIQDLKNEKILAEKQLAQIKTKYKSGPDVASLEQQIAVLDEKIGAEIDSIVGAVNAQYLVAASKEKELEKAVEDARTAAQQISEMEFQYKALRRDVDSTQSLFEEMQKRAKETEITKNLAANNIVVVSEARVPGTSYPPAPQNDHDAEHAARPVRRRRSRVPPGISRQHH